LTEFCGVPRTPPIRNGLRQKYSIPSMVLIRQVSHNCLLLYVPSLLIAHSYNSLIHSPPILCFFPSLIHVLFTYIYIYMPPLCHFLLSFDLSFFFLLSFHLFEFCSVFPFFSSPFLLSLLFILSIFFCSFLLLPLIFHFYLTNFLLLNLFTLSFNLPSPPPPLFNISAVLSSFLSILSLFLTIFCSFAYFLSHALLYCLSTHHSSFLSQFVFIFIHVFP